MKDQQKHLDLIQIWTKDPTKVWFFDYDLTLYPWNEAHVLHSLDGNISRFIEKKFQLTNQEAHRIRQKYWQDHGTTLQGLMLHENICPQEYFDYIHTGDHLCDPKPNPTLRFWLESIQGPKFIFTNARKDWAIRGLKSIGILEIFTDIFDLEYFGWAGKPQPTVYSILNQLGHPPTDIIFVDDKYENLIPAHSLGWNTVWIQGEQKAEVQIPCISIHELADLFV